MFWSRKSISLQLGAPHAALGSRCLFHTLSFLFFLVPLALLATGCSKRSGNRWKNTSLSLCFFTFFFKTPTETRLEFEGQPAVCRARLRVGSGRARGRVGSDRVGLEPASNSNGLEGKNLLLFKRESRLAQHQIGDATSTETCEKP